MANLKLKPVFRHIFRHKTHVFINVLGLSAGIAASVLIALFVFRELSYDNFHENRDEIYRVILDGKIGEQEILGAYTPAAMAATVKEEIPEIVDAVRMDNWGETAIRIGERTFLESPFVLADSSFFRIFSIKMLRGNPDQALNQPHTVILTESTANRLFGDEDPMGKTMKIGSDETQYSVTGVCQDIPENSHFEFSMLGSFLTHWRANDETWLSNSFATYLLLTEQADPKTVEDKIRPILLEHIGPELRNFMGISIDEFAESGGRYGMLLQPLTGIHLDPEVEQQFKPPHDKKYIYIFSIVGIAILLIACINYMNLATAQAAGRAHEVGIRKVVGSSRKDLVRQFLTESSMLSIMALIAAILIVELAGPYFNNIVHQELSLNYFETWYIIPLLLIIALIVGAISGSYPSFYLASFHPVRVLTGKTGSGRKSRILRSILVVFQLTVSIVIILSTVVIYRQIRYMLNKDLGFDREQVMILQNAHVLGEKIPVFKKEIDNIPGVMASSHSTSIPGHTHTTTSYLIEGRGQDNMALMATSWTDHDQVPALGFEMAAGRFFSDELASDSLACVINETAVKHFNLEDPLSVRFIRGSTNNGERTYHPVVGVVKDFHYQSLHHNIYPYVMMNAGNSNRYGYISIRLNPENIRENMKKVEAKWNEFTGDYPIQYSFLDQDFESFYEEDKRTGKLSLSFGILAILIACLGLYGLTSFTAAQRTREIGIRKTQGASSQTIIRLLSGETGWLVLLASLFAWPAAYFLLSRWLDNYHYRISLSPFDFILATLVALVVSLLTISYRSLQAARTNPAEAMRYE